MIEVGWRAREEVLPCVGACAAGAPARAMARRLRGHTPVRRGWVAPDLVVVLGADAPWVDGAVWLGVSPSLPGVFWPTVWEVTAPADLWLRRLGADAEAGPRPWVVVPGLWVCLGPERLLDHDALAVVA